MSSTNRQYIRTICPLSPCPSSDGVVAAIENGKVVRLDGDRKHPWSRGYICPKGRNEWKVLYHPRRFRHPILQTPSGKKEISWEEATEIAAQRLGEVINRFGPLSICSTLPKPSIALFTRSLAVRRGT